MYTYCACKKFNSTKFINVKKEISTIFASGREIENSSFHLINGRRYQWNLLVLEAELLFKLARKQWTQAEENVLSDNTYRRVNIREIRKEIIQILSLCRCSLNETPLNKDKLIKHLIVFKNSIKPWSELSERSLIKLTADLVTKDDTSPIHQYFHMYLDTQWLLLTLNHLCGSPLDIFQSLLKDLVTISFAFYKRQKTEFCTCLKRLWLLLQFYKEKLHGHGKTFWEEFNEAVKNSEALFTLWLLNEIAALQGFNVEGDFVGVVNDRVKCNYACIESKLKTFNSDRNNETLWNCCKYIDALVNNWWSKESKLEPYQILWEIFNKYIDTAFGVYKTSAIEFIDIMDRIFNANVNTSYEYFLSILNKFLKRYPERWSKMRGRIYCKLSSNKLNEFGEDGLLNVSLLFLTLTNVNMKEISDKLLELLSSLTQARLYTPLVINILMSVLILHVREEIRIGDYCEPLTIMMRDLVGSRETFHLIRVYNEGFEAVLNVSLDFGLGQSRLIGPWVIKYLTACPYGDACYFLNVILSNVKRIKNAGAWNEWQSVLRENVLPVLKSLAPASNVPLQVGELAALLDDNANSVSTFTSDQIAPKIVCRYVTTLIGEDFKIPKLKEGALLHAWIRCCLLNTEGYEELTLNVLKLSIFSDFPNRESNDKPIIWFIKLLRTGGIQQTNPKDLVETCFGKIDAWAGPYLANPPNEGEVIHLYTCIALLFFHCASILYHKTRINCLLNRLVSVFLLPKEVLTGNPPHPLVLGAIQRTWHRFVQGIFTLETDAYLERTIKDLVVRYIAFLPIQTTPILNCLEDEALTLMIFDKISLALLAGTSRTTNSNTQRALKIVKLALEQSTNAEPVLKSTLGAIFEVIVFNTEKGVAIDVITWIAGSDKYTQAKPHIAAALINVTNKHLAFSANLYFQFVNTLAKIVPHDVCAILDGIKKRVNEVERMRGVGYDYTLRQGIDRLETSLCEH